jgi:hypothetical protein
VVKHRISPFVGTDLETLLRVMLLDIVIAKQAAVVTIAELADALPGRSSSNRSL